MNNQSQRTLSIIKPDAVERGIEDNIKKIFTDNSLRIVEEKKNNNNKK